MMGYTNGVHIRTLPLVRGPNLDGRPDLAIANNGSDNVTILLNTCTVRPCPTNFTAAGTSPEAVGTQPVSGATGDLNLDGHPDLAVANSFSANLAILLGNGSGDFTQPASSPETVESVDQLIFYFQPILRRRCHFIHSRICAPLVIPPPTAAARCAAAGPRTADPDAGRPRHTPLGRTLREHPFRFRDSANERRSPFRPARRRSWQCSWPG